MYKHFTADLIYTHFISSDKIQLIEINFIRIYDQARTFCVRFVSRIRGISCAEIFVGKKNWGYSLFKQQQAQCW